MFLYVAWFKKKTKKKLTLYMQHNTFKGVLRGALFTVDAVSSHVYMTSLVIKTQTHNLQTIEDKRENKLTSLCIATVTLLSGTRKRKTYRFLHYNFTVHWLCVCFVTKIPRTSGTSVCELAYLAKIQHSEGKKKNLSPLVASNLCILIFFLLVPNIRHESDSVNTLAKTQSNKYTHQGCSGAPNDSLVCDITKFEIKKCRGITSC